MFVGLSESVTAPCGAATLTEGARRTRAPARATEEKVLGLVTHHPSCPSLATGEAHLLHPFLSLCLPAGRRELPDVFSAWTRTRHSVHGPWRWFRPSLGSPKSKT